MSKHRSTSKRIPRHVSLATESLKEGVRQHYRQLQADWKKAVETEQTAWDLMFELHFKMKKIERLSWWKKESTDAR